MIFMASPLKGTQRANHKYIERYEKNGKYVYVYDEDVGGRKTNSSASSNTTYDTGSASSTRRSFFKSSWADVYNRVKNRKLTSIVDNSASGRSAARKLGIKIYKAKLDTSISKADYDKTISELQSQVAAKKENREKYYKDLLESDIENYKKQLSQRNTDADNVNRQVDIYRKQLWDNTYKKKLDSDLEAIDLSFDKVDKYLKARL